ncbi:MAG TPA: efflux RND transporter permease subunit [Pirellulaceae bacterium]|nr:efflux RND transporter permease subunit [Pirellulaceae bacterium]
MRSVVRWAIRNSPAMNTFLVALLVVGAVSMIIMRREVFPNFELEIVLVRVPFPGATPAEVEEGVCQKIESAVANLDGVKKVTSRAGENFGFVILELHGHVRDVQRVLNDVRSQIDQIRSQLPPTAEDPLVQQIIFRSPAITLGIIGPPPAADPTERLEQERQLRDLAETIRSDLLELKATRPSSTLRAMFAPLFQPSGPAVTAADVVNAKPFEIFVEVPESTLREYGMSLARLSSIVRAQNIEVPAGKLELSSEEVLLRGNVKRTTASEIANIPVLTQPNGDAVLLGDLGVVIDGFEERVAIHQINDRTGLALRISKTASEDLFTIVESVREYVANKRIPAGYEIRMWGDVSLDVQDRLRMLTTNGITGLILVFLSLAIFLELRLAFWVALGIPVAILGAGFILLMAGQTLNMLTLFAFLMALGIVVDDAIIIGENIYAKRQIGYGPIKAAIEGTIEVIPSVAASVATTVIAFAPLMFVAGVMGKFLAVLPFAVIAMLILSLLESIFVLPSHLAHDNNMFMRMMGSLFYLLKPLLIPLALMQRIATRGLQWVIDSLYTPLLVWSLHNKRIVLSTVVGLFLVAAGLILGGIAPLSAFPKIDGREITASVVFPDGTSVDFALSASQRLTEAIRKVDREIEAEFGSSVVVNIYERIGEVGNANLGPTGVTNGSHVASVEVQLVSAEHRPFISSDDIIARWRDKVPKIPGAEILKFGSPTMGPGGMAIEFQILADERGIPYLDEITHQFKSHLARLEGVHDIEDNARLGKWESVLSVNELGQALRLTRDDLLRTVRGAFFGEEVMRFQRGRHEIKLMLRYPRADRQTMESLSEIRIRDGNGIERRLGDVANIEFRRAYATINRLNQRRAVTISADVDRKKAVPSEVVAELQSEFIPQVLKEFEEKYGANFGVTWEGEQQNTQESMSSMFKGFVVALMCMFVLLTLEFRSYTQPLIIMSIIPFGWIGAVMGHALLGLDVSMMSLFGLIALTGVIVNDSIVLVDFINHRIRDGMSLNEALISAGKRRLRPILLTSLTTVAGLIPMLLERSLQAQVLIPMACSLVFGLATGTLLILILVPIFYQMYAHTLQFFGIPLCALNNNGDHHEQGVADEPLLENAVV